MAYVNLPGIFENVLDGNLTIIPDNGSPSVMVIGTASKGPSETVVAVTRPGDAAKTFGKDGTLIRGMYEVVTAGATNVRLYRVGATPASLAFVGAGTGDGLTITTIAADDSSGTDYTLFYEDATGRLRVYRASDDELVYDNNPAYPLEKVDLGEVAVEGTAEPGANTDIGTLGTPVTLEDGDAIGSPASVYTAGTDGLSLSRMELYEALHEAYRLFQDQVFDVCVPMNVFLDDLNVMDLTPTQITNRALTGLSAYPSAGDTDDVLGKVYTEEYQGKTYFWWYFPADPTDSTPPAPTAQIFPSVGSASATTTIDGTTLADGDFHEVNFAYQLANFCYTQSRDSNEVVGTVGVLPPNSFSLKDVALWVGTMPTTEVDANGNTVIASGGNGTGLLGNKFMSGRQAVTSQLTSFNVDGIAGLFNGGFIATDDGWLDGTQLKDTNDSLVDIGKYISVVASYPTLANPSRATAYNATGAPTYAGFFSVLPANSAPTNKLINVTLPFRVNTVKLDLLAGQRFVTFHTKTRGIVVSDAPTAARPNSDYRRLSTVRQVKASVDAVRRVAEPFLGEGMTGTLLAGLDTAISTALQNLVKTGVISRFEHQVVSTPQQKILGQATVELKLVPAFELRQITVVVALAAV
jgi:hypothetical protein